MYTQGRWKQHKDFVIDEKGDSIHIPNTSRSYNENIANAHLIAASPTMYKALKAIQRWLLEDGKIERKDLFNKQFVKANDLTVKALAKVEGKEN